ncbi:MAG: hypothetical protein HYV28_01135 [Ignavibacteriales bacterium]|nr:hypothetical protein [Ignavibacteriales bacterium]
MAIKFDKKRALHGLLITGAGDTIASLILGMYSVPRMLGMMAVAAFLYSIEIQYFFNLIDKYFSDIKSLQIRIARMLLALSFFNPFWIARHLFFINLFQGHFYHLNMNLFKIGAFSYVSNIPVSLTVNYLIQNKVPLKFRFIMSTLFSALMAIYYALSEEFFR